MFLEEPKGPKLKASTIETIRFTIPRVRFGLKVRFRLAASGQ
jgi:hypothetical protein